MARGAVMEVVDPERGEVSLVEDAQGDPHRRAQLRDSVTAADLLGPHGAGHCHAPRRAAGEVVEHDEGVGVRPMQIVEDQHDRGERLDQRDERLERVDPARNRSRRANAHLGEDERKRREVPHVHRGRAEHLSQCQRDRRVRDARHELAAAGPPDGDALQLARRRLEQRRLADAELTLDQHEAAGAVARCLERPAEEPELVSRGRAGARDASESRREAQAGGRRDVAAG